MPPSPFEELVTAASEILHASSSPSSGNKLPELQWPQPLLKLELSQSQPEQPELLKIPTPDASLGSGDGDDDLTTIGLDDPEAAPKPKAFVCPLATCNMSYRKKFDFPFPPPLLPSQTLCSQDLVRHVHRKHPELKNTVGKRSKKNARPFPCPDPSCDRSYERKYTLDEHWRDKHPGQGRFAPVTSPSKSV